jgi:hypothetical protein
MVSVVILLGGLAALLLLSKSEKESKPTPEYPGIKPGETPMQEVVFIESVGGQWTYKPEIRATMLQALKTKSVHAPTGEADPMLSIMVEESKIVEQNRSAYQAAKMLHDGGFNVWVTPTLMNPYPQDRLLYATPNPTLSQEIGIPVDPPAGVKVALISSFADEWPPDPSEMPPTPPPPPTDIPIPGA